MLDGGHFAIVQENNIDKWGIAVRLENECVVSEFPLVFADLFLQHLLEDALASLLGPNLQEEVTFVELAKLLVHDLDLEYWEVSSACGCWIVVAVALHSIVR